jgi:hypothetical protein
VIISLSLHTDQLYALVRTCRDQAQFFCHAAEQEEITGYYAYATDDYARAAQLTALADQILAAIQQHEKISA